MRFEIVIPARNEEAFIAGLVREFAQWPDVTRVIVVDNASEDATRRLAAAAGAEIVEEPRIGKGAAVLRGLRSAASETVFVCDADIRGLTRDKVVAAVGVVARREADLCRLAMRRPAEAAPVTTLLAAPLLRHLYPEVELEEPIGGIFAVNRSKALSFHLPHGWGFDVALTLALVEDSGVIRELPAPELSHRQRALQDYQVMAFEVADAILSRARGRAAGR